jgi:AcrR family transcriptional regulator
VPPIGSPAGGGQRTPTVDDAQRDRPAISPLNWDGAPSGTVCHNLGRMVTTLRERKKQRTAAAIAESTVTLVADRGLDAVRIEDICELADVGRSTFFRYFDSKEASFVAGVHWGRLDVLVDALGRRPPDEDACTAVRAAFLEVIAEWRQVRDVLLLDHHIRSTSAAVAARAISEHLRWEDAIAAAVEGRLAPGPARALRARLVAGAYLVAVRTATDEWLASGAERSPVNTFATAFDVVADLMGGRRSAGS